MSKFFIFIRSTIFNILFYGLTALACIVLLPGLLLPRRHAMLIVKFFVSKVYFLEKYILGLDYEVRGLENLPESGSYLVAAKHQSPYETMKLNILFDDPAVILKQELLKVPLWGRFLKIIKPIAIDRSKGKRATQQIIEGAQEVSKDARPIIIFPQGTRVYTWQTSEDKPYKAGVARMHDATGLPIVPMALNTGVFWPRQSWVKQPGKVVFEFLEPVTDKHNIAEIMQDLETRLETKSKDLEREARKHYKYLPPAPETSGAGLKSGKKAR